MMEHKFTEKEMKGFWSFLVETFTLSEDETAAVCHQIPMTQDIYDSILDKCDEIGPDLDRLFYCMLKEYPEYTAVRAERIEERIKDLNCLLCLRKKEKSNGRSCLHESVLNTELTPDKIESPNLRRVVSFDSGF